jgi:aminopeptidase N
MKKIFLSLLAFSALTNTAQEHFCAKHKQATFSKMLQSQMSQKSSAAPQQSHEHSYDVKFVHLDLNVERNSKFISGNVKTVAQVAATSLDTFMTILHTNHSIDSIHFNGVLVSAIREDSLVKVHVSPTLNQNTSFTVQIWYKGTAPTGGSAIGSGFSNATSGAWGNQVTWSLSESFVAYHWWPCKQVLTDKIDSSWVFITTDSLNKAGSNGMLESVVTTGAKKRYEWKSRTPIDYYLISVAVAKYKEYNIYAKPLYLQNDSILVQNFIYDNAINNSGWISGDKPSLDAVPDQIEFLSEKYGMYPFYKEKYGHCMAPFSGGMEHQTMTTQGFFEFYLNAHELAHQWWGDNVTCKSWADIWINEGFASYTEHLIAQYLDNGNFLSNLGSAHSNVMSQAGGSVRIPAKDTMNTGRIFSSRLTYDKGGAIIHSLRFVTNNDSLWFQTLRGFQKTYANSTAGAAEFANYYQSVTNINPTQFFNQWYYGEGYPTFNVKWNYTGTQCIIKNVETVSMPQVTPLFITPLEYRIKRTGKQDTTIRLVQQNATEIYTISLTGTVTSINVDPNNWIINGMLGSSRDATLGVDVTPPPPPNGIAESTFENISIGPNPTSGVVEIQNTGTLSGQIKVYDINGKLIINTELKTGSLDLGANPAGVYLVKICDTEGIERQSVKIIRR